MTGSGLTIALANRASAVTYEALDPDVRRIAGHCLLDWLGVTIAGAAEPSTVLLREILADEGGQLECSVVATSLRLPALAAALVNGTASHALDYDDVNIAMPGHPSVAIIPALLALAERRRASGAEFTAAFVAGYEVACGLGQVMSPGHYAAGFHPTGTLGAIGAAAACGRLLGLGPEPMAQALGIAATQAAGLKGLFGTMCKPFHAGRAASNGLLAALLAARGFTGRIDALECAQGFVVTHGPNFAAHADLTGAVGEALRGNLFKYHAACYLTHAPIEALTALREQHGLRPDTVDRVELELDRSCESVCHICEPKTGLEAKFSLRLTAAMALRGDSTASLEVFTDALAREADLVALRDRVAVRFLDGKPMTWARVRVDLKDGRRLEATYDSGTPQMDLDLQESKLTQKFLRLAGPILGEGIAERLAERVSRLGQLSDISDLIGASVHRGNRM